MFNRASNACPIRRSLSLGKRDIAAGRSFTSALNSDSVYRLIDEL